MEFDHSLSPSEYSAPPARVATRQPIEVSLIDLVLAATDASEDEFEISDGITHLIQSGAVTILSREQDPMLHCTPPDAALPAPHPLTR
jgi:hypothetical protein